MFSVVFEVRPAPDQWETYLGLAKMLRPELERVDGFIDNIRYRSLTREGWLLSLSNWRDEKSLVRWRTTARHHEVQERGRSTVLLDYHLRVGQVTQDTEIPLGHDLREQRLDETEVGNGTTVMLLNAKRATDWIATATAEEVVIELGLEPHAAGLLSWDCFDAVLMPGEVIALATWADATAARAGFKTISPSQNPIRQRSVRVIRDYRMFDRREAPQYYPDAMPR